MAAGLLTVLKAECEKQHARAEKAEAALAQVQGERDATMSAIEKRVVELREWQAHKECRADIKGDGAAVCRDEANWLTKLLKPTTPEREER